MLSTADGLPRPEKVLLARQLDNGFRDVKARLESKAEAARKLVKALPPAATADGRLLKKLETGPGATAMREPKRDPKLTVSPIFSSSATVRPVVSADRRWVRISFSGMFSIFP